MGLVEKVDDNAYCVTEEGGEKLTAIYSERLKLWHVYIGDNMDEEARFFNSDDSDEEVAKTDSLLNAFIYIAGNFENKRREILDEICDLIRPILDNN